MPRFTKLWYSGGEPFLREDLAAITRLFRERNGISWVNLPTNGLVRERVLADTARMLDENPALVVDLNLSLDGLAATHDRIRGVPGNFAAALACVHALEPLRARHERLRVNVLSVITAENIDELLPLARELLAAARLDGHYFEIVRGSTKEPGLAELDNARLAALYRELKPIHAEYARRRYREDGFLARELKGAYYQAGIATHYRWQMGVRAANQPWPIDCTAGRTSIVVEHDGTVRACELRGTLGQLRDVDMDFRRIYASAALGAEVQDIVHNRCRCTHSCFIWDTLRTSPRGFLWEVPRSYATAVAGK
jgi:MoaA/NifB/PqqE/SkfB family radical SAM enzyme